MSPELAEAVRILRAGGLVAFPTETVYGLGADARSEQAVARIFEAKGRPPTRALSVLLGRTRDPGRWTRWTPEAQRLAEAFWPGPLTLVLPRVPGIPDIVTGGLHTLGLRVPDHPLALDLLDAFGGGLAAPSANRSGTLSPTTAQDVRHDLGHRVDLVLDGGPCAVGLESTVLSLVDEPTILRPGAIPLAELEGILGRPIQDRGAVHARLRTPLQLHPAAAVARALAAQPEAALLWWGANSPDWPSDRIALLPDDPGAFAAALYQALRRLDALGAPVLLVRELPATSEWSALRLRLRGLASTS